MLVKILFAEDRTFIIKMNTVAAQLQILTAFHSNFNLTKVMVHNKWKTQEKIAFFHVCVYWHHIAIIEELAMSLRIHQTLVNPRGLSGLLERLMEGLSVHSPDYIQNDVRFYLDKDFSIDGTSPFKADKPLIINPNTLESGTIAPKSGEPQSLTLIDVLHLLDQIYKELRDVPFQQKHVLILSGDISAEFNKLITETYNNFLSTKRHEVESVTVSIPDKQKVLIEIAEHIHEAVEALTAEAVESEGKEKRELSEEMPAWLEEAMTVPMRKKEHWEKIKEVINPKEEKGFLELAIAQYRNTSTQDFPGIQLRKDDPVLSLIALRNFLNEWAKEILEEDKHDPFEYKRAFIKPETEKYLILFPSKTTNSVTQQDIEKVQDLDIAAVKSFKEWLLVPLEDYKERPAPVGVHAAAASTEDGGGESPDDQEEKLPLPKTDEEKKELLKQVLEHQRNVRQETVRLQVIATNFVLAFNNLQNLPPELLSDEAYVYLSRDINAEIMDLINRDPEALNEATRAATIRKFLFRLMANPKFQAHLALLREKYVEVEIAQTYPQIEKDDKEKLKKQILEDLIKNPKTDVESLLSDVYTTLKVSNLELSDAQKAELKKQLSARLTQNPRLNVELFLTDAFASIKVSEVGALTAGQQVELTEKLKQSLEKNPNASVSDLLKEVYGTFDAQVGALSDDQKNELYKQLQSTISTNPIDRVDKILNDAYAAGLALNEDQKKQLKDGLIKGLSKDPGINLQKLVGQVAKNIGEPASEDLTKFNPNSLTKSHFDILLEAYGLDEAARKELFDGVDLLMLLRVSPERISRFTDSQFQQIFGEAIGKLDGSQKATLANLLSAYFMLRRTWFEKEYNTASVSQAQDIVYNNTSLTDEEFTELLRKKKLLKDSGMDAKHFVRASILTKSQVANFSSTGHPEAAETEKAAGILLDDRKELYARIAREMAAADEEYKAFLYHDARIRFINDEDLTETQKRNFLALIEATADISPFEAESGVVADDQGTIIRSEQQAQQSFEQKSGSRFSNTGLSSIKEEGEKLIGSAVVGAALGGAAFLVPPEAQKKIGKAVVIGGAVAGTGAVMAIIKFGELVSQFGFTGAGAIVGGLAGVAGGAAAGGLLGAFVGGLTGVIGGAGIGAAIGNSGVSAGALVGGGAAPVATPAAATTAQVSLATKAVSAIRVAVTATPAGAAVAGLTGITLMGSTLLYIKTAGAFLPPIVQTTTQYVSIDKTASPAKAASPTTVQYSVHIQANPTYKIDIIDITDTVVVTSKDPNKQTGTVQSTDFAQYKVRLDGDAQATEDINYSIPYDGSFQDSLVTNTFTIKYNITDAGASKTEVTSAKASTCFGDCPQPKVGCWPATGRIVEGPYEAPNSTHNHVSGSGWVFLDAVDIFNGSPQDVPIYTPFDGTAAFYTYSQTNGEGGGGNYGNRVAIRTSAGAVLLFAHFDRFMPNFQPGQTFTVQAGQQLGFMGTTGNDGPGTYKGKHLHYEYRPAHSGVQGNEPAISDISALLPEPIAYKGKWQVSGTQQVVSTCGTAAQ